MSRTSRSTVKKVGTNEIAIARRFSAPPDRVFAALTEPELLKKWLSAAGRELAECEVDARTGGRYRYVFRTKSGRSFGMFGDFVEVVRDRRIVHTESYDGYDWEPLVTTTELRDDRGGTLLEMIVRYPNEAIRDEDFPNLESATEEGYARLDALLAKPR